MQAPPDARGEARLLEGLEPREAQRPAWEVLRDVCWEGPRLDPATTPAHEFLAAL